MPAFSVIIPAYNQAQYLAEAVQSVLDQRWDDYEIIVVDDGSTDETPAVAAAFGGQIRYFRQENRGLAGARNRGLKEAQGELVALLDSDDGWQPAFLEKMAALARQEQRVALYYCWARCIDADGQPLPQIAGRRAVPAGAMYETLLRANFLIPSTVVLRRAAVAAVGGFDESLRSVEDWDLWLRLLQAGHTFAELPACLVRYRLHGDSLSVNIQGMQQAKMAVVEKHFGVDDGRWTAWPADKRRAYGGAYRYRLLTAVLRRDDWSAGPEQLKRALLIDPSLAGDPDLFYELALGSQPLGQRGGREGLSLAANARRLMTMLSAVFAPPAAVALKALRATAYGTATMALGAVAYNTGRPRLGYLLQAVRWQPARLLDGRWWRFALKTALWPLLSKVRNQAKAASQTVQQS